VVLLARHVVLLSSLVIWILAIKIIQHLLKMGRGSIIADTCVLALIREHPRKGVAVQAR
jgi:hypothetical protein